MSGDNKRWFMYLFSWYLFWLGVHKLLPGFFTGKNSVAQIGLYIIFFVLASARLYVWSTSEVAKLPKSFNTVAYPVMLLSLGLVVVSFVGTITLFLIGAQISGVPAGMSLVVFGLIGTTSILVVEIVDWLTLFWNRKGKPL